MQGSRPYPIGIHPKDSSYATPQCPPWARDSVLVNGLSGGFDRSQARYASDFRSDLGHIYLLPICGYEHGSRGTAPNMTFASWEALRWQFCFLNNLQPILLNRESALSSMWCGQVHSGHLWRFPNECHAS